MVRFRQRNYDDFACAVALDKRYVSRIVTCAHRAKHCAVMGQHNLRAKRSRGD